MNRRELIFTFHKNIVHLRKYYAKSQEAIICFSIHIDNNINKLSDYFGASLSAKDADNYKALMAHNKQKGLPLKAIPTDGKLYSNYFTSVLIDGDETLKITPMRYRVRPSGSKEEVPSKYNVFNARIDALESRQTWIPLFGSNHGIVPFTKFYEWVEGPDKKPKLISFFPKDRELMWAPVLYDEWQSKDAAISFKSFAIITDGPSPEISRMGHDRCPIFLNQNEIHAWLNPKGKSKKELYEILGKKEDVVFDYEWVS